MNKINIKPIPDIPVGKCLNKDNLTLMKSMKSSGS